MNDNQQAASPQQRQDQEHRAALYGHLRELKPNFEGLPDLGLVLSPEDEAELRAYAAANGVDFDEMKRRFEISHQVIPARDRGPIYNRHMNKRIVPLNGLKDYFHGRIAGEIYWRKCKAEIATDTQ